MTRSIFDPTGGETEQSGSRNLGPTAKNISHMPPDVVDGNVSEQEAADAASIKPGVDPAKALEEMVAGEAPAARKSDEEQVEDRDEDIER